MKSTRLRILSAVLLGAFLAATAYAPAPALADGWHHRHHGFYHHGHSSFSLGLGFFVPLYRPYYYEPPPRVVYVAPPPVCRQFNGDATIDATGGRFYGTACLWSDGRWHIVN